MPEVFLVHCSWIQKLLLSHCPSHESPHPEINLWRGAMAGIRAEKTASNKTIFPSKEGEKSRLSFFFVQLYHISLTPKNMTFWPNWYQLPFWKALLNQLMRPFTSSFKNSVVFRFCLDINRRSQEQRRIWFVYNSLCSYFTLITCHWTLF